MDLGLIRKVDLDAEMQQSYLDYAMSVIVSRALPDARDGLKPVQRRILYAMYDMGLRADSAYKKSARIVGEVLGKYHPHGDMAVYEAMARMAQDFSMRYMLVDGQGNFGSVDGDPPAAMRYTEARLTSAAMEMINQIDKNTVDFSQNFDQSLEEPVVLPAAIPNLLVNGATGIAVGMATNIPPHNLNEVIAALQFMLQQWEKLDDVTIDELMRFVQGPDFPTGGVIIQEAGTDGLISAYATGRGRILVQARAHLEEMVRGRNRIIVTELPYQVNKSALVERIAELVRGGTLDGVADLRDESDRQGMRIVIELSKTADPEKILRDLYKHTPMQTTYGINLLALVDGEPRLLSLKQALRVYLEHRLVVIRRRSEYDLARARARAHILEGLLIALQHLDEVISIIRGSPDADQAKLRLIKRFKLSELQAQAILDMQLRRLASLERKKIDQEYKELSTQIKDLETLLKSPKKMRLVASDELGAMKQAYGDRRRTSILNLKEGARAASLLTTTDITPAQAVWVAVTSTGQISRTVDDQLPVVEMGNAPRWIIQANTHQTLYLVSEQGNAAAIPVHSIPEAGSLAEGVSVSKVSPLPDNEKLVDLFTLSPRTEGDAPLYILTVTRAGLVKKSLVDELPGPSAHHFILTKVNESDALIGLRITTGSGEPLLVTSAGMAIRFSEMEIRPMGLVAAGVGGMKLGKGDQVIAIDLVTEGSQVFLAASNGRTKRVPAKEFPLQGRYGQGVAAWKLVKGIQMVGALIGKPNTGIIVHFDSGSALQTRLDRAPLSTRQGQGTALIDAKTGAQIVGLTRLIDQSDGEREKPPRSKKAAITREKPLPLPVDTANDGVKPGVNGKKPLSGKAVVVETKSRKQVSPYGKNGSQPATQLPLMGELLKAQPAERKRGMHAKSKPAGEIVETPVDQKKGRATAGKTKPGARSVSHKEKMVKKPERKFSKAEGVKKPEASKPPIAVVSQKKTPVRVSTAATDSKAQRKPKTPKAPEKSKPSSPSVKTGKTRQEPVALQSSTKTRPPEVKGRPAAKPAEAVVKKPAPKAPAAPKPETPSASKSIGKTPVVQKTSRGKTGKRGNTP